MVKRFAKKIGFITSIIERKSRPVNKPTTPQIGNFSDNEIGDKKAPLCLRAPNRKVASVVVVLLKENPTNILH